MKEILGAELDKAFKELNINAKKTYQIQNKSWKYCEDYQVWELSDEDYEKLCNINNEQWKEDWGWWRSAEGSNLGYIHKRFKINNHYIKAWDGVKRKEDKLYIWNREYKDLLSYFCYEIGTSTEGNVCAVAIDLAHQNNITMAELFSKYQA